MTNTATMAVVQEMTDGSIFMRGCLQRENGGWAGGAEGVRASLLSSSRPRFRRPSLYPLRLTIHAGTAGNGPETRFIPQKQA